METSCGRDDGIQSLIFMWYGGTTVLPADNAADLKVPLVKAAFFASGAWQDVKSETIQRCQSNNSRSRHRCCCSGWCHGSDELGAAGGGRGQCKPCPKRGLDYLDFALANQDLVATEELATDELTASVSEKGTAADSSSSDGEGDNNGAPQPGTAGAALAAVDTLRIYLCSEPGKCDLLDNVEHSVLKRALA
ncbi:hypothetical protein HPB50_014169 [Hyalomma asiaticum]|uniref:Uncharacterized protein n=1 Tax=Hyalomma asiaticum TaxID=266040 RepID=A0ACB7SHB9_HYAAI|nr:hypothetical protein HPB50_014169 [Hyalomma asiaticum]